MDRQKEERGVTIACTTKEFFIEKLHMLVNVGWKKDVVEKSVPFLPSSGWMGDNLLKQEDSTGKHNMDWWKGKEVEAYGSQIMVKTLYDFLDKVYRVPERPVSAPMRMPTSGISKIKGAGDVLADRVEYLGKAR